MPKNVICRKCNNLVNGWCEKVVDSPDPNMWRECRHFLEKTNADRISDTDDELATMLHAVKLGFAPWCDYHCENEGDDGCDNCIKKWLQQPAEGDA